MSLRLRGMHGVMEVSEGRIVVATESEDESDTTIRLARDGDRAALLSLIDRCRGSILSAIAGIRPPANLDLEEAAHVARVQIFEKFASGYDGTGTPCGWMAVVARNRTRDLIRAESRHSNRSVSIDLVDGEARVVAVPSATGAVDTWDLVNRVLAELPQDDAELLRLHYLHGLSMNELAERLSYSYEGVRSKLARACMKAHQIIKVQEQ